MEDFVHWKNSNVDREYACVKEFTAKTVQILTGRILASIETMMMLICESERTVWY